MMLANADGSNVHKIASGGAWPVWNAATNKILYGKWGKDDSGTYVYDVATKTETKILDKKIGSGSSFSHDGQWVYGLTKALNGRTVFKMRSDGWDFTHVGFTGQMDSRPMVSPDGKELVWGHGRYGDPDIFHAFLDGKKVDSKKVTNLTPNSSWERYIDVNPKTGERVVSSRKSGNAELYLLGTDGEEVQLTHQPSNEVGGRWSTDGEQLVYSSNATGSYNVYVMDRSGHKRRQLTFGEQNITATDWSVDGKQIVATVGHWGTNHLVLVDVATGKTTEIKLAGRSALDGTFTHDGKSLVFAASVEGGFELIVRNLHSGKNNVLYSIKGDVYSLSMSPDGSKVAYSSDKDGDSEIFVAKMDGAGISQVTDNYREDNNPRWLPDSKSMVFDSDRYNNFESFKIDVDGSGRVRF
ncbi:MAG: hypothetical protein MJK04_29830, partial [Psychrosphaera sp.]|nr:hypothetical protein [Psychrosphaera sp.]